MKSLSIEITQQCHLGCLYCSSNSNIGCTYYKLSTDKILSIIDEIKEMQYDELILSGGEPFLHNGIQEIIRYAAKNNIRVIVYTSGITNESQIEQSHKSGIHKLIFDLPSLNYKTYNKITNTKYNLEKVVQNINISKQLGIITELNVVPNKLNINEIDSIISFAIKNKVDKVNFLRLIIQGRAKENKEELELSPDETQQLKERLQELKLKHDELVRIGIPLAVDKKECNINKCKTHIMFNGNIVGCEAFKYIKMVNNKEEVKPPNILNTTLKNALQTSEYFRIQREFIQEQLELNRSNNYCENCPVQIYNK